MTKPKTPTSWLQKITTGIAGIAALITAAIGLKAAIINIWPQSTVTLPNDYIKPNGHLTKTSDGWLETDDKVYMSLPWKEVSRTATTTTLFDGSRSMYLKFPNAGGQVQWSYINPMVWHPLYIVEPAPHPKAD